VRAEQNIPAWWRSSVCTELYCYSIPDDSATWTLLPGDSDMIYIHMYTYGYTDTGNVVVRLFDVSNPADSVRIMFHCDALTGIEELSAFSLLTIDPEEREIKYQIDCAGELLVTDEWGQQFSVAVIPGRASIIRLAKPGLYILTFIRDEQIIESRKVVF
jgi:hypothetical protein